MNDKEQRYFNFPVVLLEGFLVDCRQVLDNVWDYAAYVKTLEYQEREGFEWLEGEDVTKAVEISDSFFGVKTGDKPRTYENGKQLYDSIPEKTPKVGLNKEMFFDYYKNDKTEFEKACLLGFLAIKSILQNKPYCKTNNGLWLARMDGKVKSVNDLSELSKPIQKYNNEYQTKKIKRELRLYWKLTYYSRYTRGFYVSLKLSLEDLVFEAEKRRASRLNKNLDLQQREAIKRAISKLSNI